MKRIPLNAPQVKPQHIARDCAICGNNLPFQMPDHIIEELRQQRVVFFAGAGISTENRNVWPYTLYDDVRQEMAIPDSEEISFPDLMTRYCAQPKGKIKLLQKVQERFAYIKSFPSIDRFACRFHRELSTLFPIDNIITTNWDDYFERECGAVPFVTAADFALWDTPARKVFKIHGSINNYGSVVASTEDYEKCYEMLRDGILGAVLKQIIGTKTVIYVGYSFRDSDFINIYRFLRNEMAAVLPTSYIVTPDSESDAQFKELGLTPIYTDPTYFVSILKKHLVLDGEMIDDARFDGIFPELQQMLKEGARFRHSRGSMKDPNSLYVWAYQDGLVHGFERMLTMENTGEYSHTHRMVELIQRYKEIRKDKLKERAYFDVAYVDGYINALTYLLASDKERKYLPRYYVYGQKQMPRSLSEYRKALKGKVHKAAYRRAKKTFTTRPRPDIVLHHTPFLL